MRNPVAVLAFIAGLLQAGACAAQGASQVASQEPAPSPYVIADVVTIHSKILNEDRKIFVYNPDAVGGNILPAYPVMYLLEENDMPMVAGTVKYLSSYNEQMPAMLVIGIDGGNDRIRDMTPTHALYDNAGKRDDTPDSWLATSGGADAFLRFVREEVMPYVEQHYRTAPFKILAGHSVGGLNTLYALTAHPDIFDAYLAVSPSLWWDRGGMLRMAGQRLNVPAGERKFLFLADSPETGAFGTYVNGFLSVVKARKAPGLHYHHRFYPRDTHGGIAARAYYDGLRYLYPDWNIADTDISAARIRQHYKVLSTRLGYDVQPGLGMVSDWGNGFLRKGRVDDALDMFRLNAGNFPASADAQVDLGNAYARKGDKPDAIKAYQTARSINPGYPDIAAKLAEVQK